MTATLRPWRHRVRLAGRAVAASMLVLVASAPAGAEPPAAEEVGPADVLVIDVAALHVGDGTVHRPGRMIVEDGVIVNVGGLDLESPEGARHWDERGRVATPGLVNPSVATALAGNEASGALSTAALSAVDARDPWDPWLATVRAEGVVAVCLAPEGGGLFQGRAATLGTQGPGADGASVLAADAALVVTLETASAGSAARAAARAALARELDRTGKYGREWKTWNEHEAKLESEGPRRARGRGKGEKPPTKPKRDEGREVLLRVVEKKLPLRVRADRMETVLAALQLARKRGVELVVEGCLECAPVASDLADSQAIVVLSPLRLPIDEGPRGEPQPDLVDALDAAGVRLAVSGGGSWPWGPGWLRTAAADLVGRGLHPDRAIAAMTGEAAAAAGVGSTLGRLGKGRRASFLLWSGAPLDPAARLERLVEPEHTHAPEAAADSSGGEEDRT